MLYLSKVYKGLQRILCSSGNIKDVLIRDKITGGSLPAQSTENTDTDLTLEKVPEDDTENKIYPENKANWVRHSKVAESYSNDKVTH